MCMNRPVNFTVQLFLEPHRKGSYDNIVMTFYDSPSLFRVKLDNFTRSSANLVYEV